MGRDRAARVRSPRKTISEGGATLAVTTIRPPHGGTLVDLCAVGDEAAELTGQAAGLPSWRLTRRQRHDLELLACGGFSPLRTFLGEDDYAGVCKSMRLADGTLWPIPVTLDVPEEIATSAPPRRGLALRDRDGSLLGVMQVKQAWRPDRGAEAASVFGTTDLAHPGADYLLRHGHPWYITGELRVLSLPAHPDFPQFRRTPAQVRAEFARRGWPRVVAFQTRNPLHRAHQELTLRASRQAGAHLLIHPVVGVTKPGDIDAHTRVRCYQAILRHYPQDRVLLCLLPLAMRMGGPREAVWHAIIRKNYGATHFIVGRDHAGPGVSSAGRPFYESYAAQELLRQHAGELGIGVLAFPRLVYVPSRGAYLPEDEAPAGAPALSISGTELRQRLFAGRDLPAWFTHPEIAAELRRAYPPRSGQAGRLAGAASVPVTGGVAAGGAAR
jgi:sulfate adenylyltransferase